MTLPKMTYSPDRKQVIASVVDLALQGQAFTMHYVPPDDENDVSLIIIFAERHMIFAASLTEEDVEKLQKARSSRKLVNNPSPRETMRYIRRFWPKRALVNQWGPK